MGSSVSFGIGPQTSIKQELALGDTKFVVDQHLGDDERSVMADLFLKHQLIGYFTSRKDISKMNFEEQLRTRDSEIGDMVLLLKQRAKPASFDLKIPNPQMADIIGVPPKPSEGVTGKSPFAEEIEARLAMALIDFDQRRWLKALQELASIRASIDTMTSRDAVYLNLKQQFQNVIDENFGDGVLLAPETKEPYVKLNTSKDSFPGRALRSTLNQCVAIDGCPAKDLAEVLLIVENFNVGGINDAVKFWRAQGGHLNAADFHQFIEKSEFFIKTKATYGALKEADRKPYLDALCDPILSRVHKPWGNSPGYVRDTLQLYLNN
jgi:hypothetical protein